MKNRKFGWSYYFQPTPKNLRRLGDGLLAAAAFAGASAIVADYKWVALGAFVLGVVGKFLTNLAHDEE